MAKEFRGDAYLFEPEYDNFEEEPVSQDSASQDESLLRLQGTSWCTCDNCVVMPSPLECICCKEISQVTEKMSEIDLESCITNHPGFNTGVLDEWTLQIAYFQYRQQYGGIEGHEFQKYRYTAYRQLVRMCWQFLGKNNRVVLPSCAVHKIRQKYPSNTQEYKGFTYPNLK